MSALVNRIGSGSAEIVDVKLGTGSSPFFSCTVQTLVTALFEICRLSGILPRACIKIF